MKIQRYSDFVSEPTKYSREEALSILEKEYAKLKNEGLTEDKINENIFSSFFSSLGGGFTDTIKNYIVDWAAEKIGIEPFDSEGNPTFFYQVVRNAIENIEISEIGGYFGKGSCKNWSKAIVKALMETLEERGISYVLPILGLNINMNTGLGGTISSGFRETLTNYINNTQFMSNIEKYISDKICGFNLGDILSDSDMSREDKQKIKKQIENAENKDPEIYTKAMKTGLSGIFQNMF